MALLALAGVATFLACEDTPSPPTDFGPLLRTVTESVILPAQTTLVARGDELGAAVTALASAPNQAALDKAQSAWRAARSAYRALDAAHFGPVADLAISERIDAAPASTAEIDAIVAATTPIDAGTVGTASGQAKGFLGLEYLLFFADAGGSAPRLQGDGVAARRRALAGAMADEIAAATHQLADAWAAGKGGYAAEVEGAGKTSKRYPSQRAAVDDLVGGVGYALELVAGVRLAEPLGKKSGGAPDAKRDPTGASDSLVADTSASLGGVRALYQSDGLAARVRLRSAALDARVAAELDDCAGKLTAIPAPFAATVEANTAIVEAAYASCKALKATWNTDVTSAVGATLKPSDNDGD